MFHRHHTRSFALLTTVLLIALLVAIAGELVTLTSSEAIVLRRRSRELAHELAVGSALLLLAEELAPKTHTRERLIAELDGIGTAWRRFDVGEVQVLVRIRDDAAKVNPNLFAGPEVKSTLGRKLTRLLAPTGLPSSSIRLHPLRGQVLEPASPSYVAFDQLFYNLGPGKLFPMELDERRNAAQPVVSDLVTLWGDGRIDLRRVDRDLLEIVVEDLRPGLAATLLGARSTDRSINFLPTALIGVDAEIRQQVEARITFDALRYALDIETAIHADRRRWYVVATIHEGRAEVLHRSSAPW